MAETPDLGAAKEAYSQAETGYKEIETSYNAAKTAWEAKQDDESLKAAFTELEPKYNETRENYSKAKDSYFDLLKSNVREGYWPEDWREDVLKVFTDKDGKPLDDAAKEKLNKRLARYASPRESIKALIEAQNKISSGLAKIPGKDALPEEIKEYREIVGIPESPEKYDLTLGDGMVIGDEDKPMIEGFLKDAHASNFTPDQVKTSLNWYYKYIDDQKAAQFQADNDYHIESKTELKAEWGPEYQINENLMANYLATDFPEGVAELIVGARLPDGRLLGNHPDIIRGIVAKARKENIEATLTPGSGSKLFDSMMAEISELEKKMATDEWYKDKKSQERYLKLIEMRDKNKK